MKSIASAEISNMHVKWQEYVRTFLFIVFFTIGATALVTSIMSEELATHFKNRQTLKQARKYLEKLEFLNTDYEVLLKKLNDDPNIIRRIAPATLGVAPNDPNTVYPRKRLEQLDAARRVLAEADQDSIAEPNIPYLLVRCNQPGKRLALFLSGAFLVLISFVFFGPTKKKLMSQES